MVFDPFDNLRKLNTAHLLRAQRRGSHGVAVAAGHPVLRDGLPQHDPPAGRRLPARVPSPPRQGVDLPQPVARRPSLVRPGSGRRRTTPTSTATKNACARITCATPTEFADGRRLLVPHRQEHGTAHVPGTGGGLPEPRRSELRPPRRAPVARRATWRPVSARSRPSTLGPASATTRVATQLLQYLALYSERQRWDDVPMQAWAPCELAA